MKRIEALIPFSHDHQHGLANALRLRRAAESGDTVAVQSEVASFLEFARGELAEHMRSEEEQLLPAVLGHGVLSDDDLLRVGREHASMRLAVSRLADAPDDADLALHAATLLHDHIRWEERELFESWQRQLAEQGSELGTLVPER